MNKSAADEAAWAADVLSYMSVIRVSAMFTVSLKVSYTILGKMAIIKTPAKHCANNSDAKEPAGSFCLMRHCDVGSNVNGPPVEATKATF